MRTKRTRLPLTEVPAALLVLLFVYSAVSKLLDTGAFHRQMLNQVFPLFFNQFLFFFLPPAEVLSAALLLLPRTRYAGLRLSFALLSAFTGYVALVLLHFYRRVPCSCGGVLGHLSWGPHLAFNFFFWSISLYGIYLELRERRDGGRG